MTRLVLGIFCFVLIFVNLTYSQERNDNNIIINKDNFDDRLSYKNPSLPIDERVNDLLSRMTMEEKFWQRQLIISIFE